MRVDSSTLINDNYFAANSARVGVGDGPTLRPAAMASI